VLYLIKQKRSTTTGGERKGSSCSPLQGQGSVFWTNAAQSEFEGWGTTWPPQ